MTRSTLNKAGLVERVQTPLVTLVPGTQVQPETTMKWNRHGQPTEVVDAAGRKTTISYNSSGNGAGLPKEQKLKQ